MALLGQKALVWVRCDLADGPKCDVMDCLSAWLQAVACLSLSTCSSGGVSLGLSAGIPDTLGV